MRCDEKGHMGRCHDRGGMLRGFVQPRLLLRVARHPTHGYELMEFLAAGEDVASSDPGNLYRILRTLEEEGLVRSIWDTSGAGPARRVYELTEDGLEYLDAWVINMRETRRKLDAFISEYENYRKTERKTKNESEK
jgi:PadR family transcriptional regulator, regulatory protein PadR